ncbi:4'-phosphopantetheinyl transferase superfamily protein [Paenibacillus sp. YPG26]|uniref:4'-phosphopantetheinyl transferase family protein n=1 Tax=Paenibacillus sp. YPG26 TaxID=2878915 RepID=UPI002040B360|nr:4'-phosphopantetheinyl transferase superfamily protein [Paenibacillus sp. YPG26]USB34370.1 4'-phosphopantetheinyl transferase superfamily protein [Paenibacillus sp. YPG26]
MIKVYAARITSFPIEHLDSILSGLPEVRRAKLLRFRFLHDLLRGATGDLLIRAVLPRMLDCSADELEFGSNLHGKPILMGDDLNIGFNVSHSGDWVVLAAGSSGRIGIDIERVNEMDLATAKQFYTEDEYNFIMKHESAEARLLRFFQIWTAKESYIKAMGQGLSIPLNIFSTVDGDRMAEKQLIGGEPWYFRPYSLEEGYLLTACADVPEFDSNVQICDIRSLVGL